MKIPPLSILKERFILSNQSFSFTIIYSVILKGEVAVSNKKKQNKKKQAPYTPKRKKVTWTKMVIYLMIAAMLLSTFLTAAFMFL